MSAIRIFIILYFSILATLFNSKWAEESLRNLPVLTCNNSSNDVNFISESYMNVKAIPNTFENIKFFAVVSDTPQPIEKLQFKEHVYIDKAVSSTIQFCAVKSYLHLLQKF